MKQVIDSIEKLIGNTPLLQLNKIEKHFKLESHIFAKMESFNLTGSIKDRVALSMLCDAEEKGLIQKGSTIIEPTSGNTGIGLSAIGKAKGYEVIIVMPDTFSIERRKLIQGYGAKVVLSEGKLGMQGAIDKANELAKELNGFIPSQFTNPANVLAHYKTTGPEIYETLSDIDILIAGIGTGGTITGTGKYLKEKNPDIKIIGVEPSSSPFLTKGIKGPHKIEGIGAGFKPEILDLDIIDEIICIENEDAINTEKQLGQIEGIMAGISSGAALHASILTAKKEKDKKIVVILPDSADRYLSTELYGE